MFGKTREAIKEKVTDPLERIATLLAAIAVGLFLLSGVLMVRGL